ncbi:glycosyl hydrolase [Rhodococcus sp. 05-2256-B2]|uniref:sialidase family protein n=1 Tax=unclassified Rhodococcus (in: high G+C Gram-positive bacteria) TaxID=192944 RepID=UPI000B9B0A33|nr:MULTISPECIES: exo-alpha-sialidase [unclassified Rhodococcus (in: high G+C Gram-positive bacteria)]OZD78735.1 glycosyl hydrolase [Rhodococcus sp. 05-2256-B4]OZD93837.1 glycosyl hydrolase [Rhodococcus sp. 05-2256-B3]OZE00935.1 glycosyl hydrolase [Rhodococcus sp. 05-2256-B2]OZE04539.1 glycosyl hydrolase [Rhodococcus sp. 05-2256-B1]
MSNTSFLTPGDLLADGTLRATSEPGRSDAFLPAPQVQNHAANLAILPDGALACVWFAGTQEGVPDISVWFSRLDAEQLQWSTPIQLSDDGTRSEQNPVLFVRDSGEVWLLWTSQHAGNQDTARVLRRISSDGGSTWGETHVLVPETDAGGVFVRQPVVQLASGRLLLPVFHCVKIDGRKWVGDRDYSGVLISDDDGATWREVVVPGSVGCVHMNIVVQQDGSLVALYRSRWADHIYRSVSTDDAETWSDPVATELPNNNSSIQAVGHGDGTLALVYNHSSALDATDRRVSLYDEIDDDGLAEGTDASESPLDDGDDRAAFWGAPRAPMTLALSSDGGVTWPVRRNLDEGDGYCLTNNSRDGSNREFSYPSIVYGPDGRIHLAYTYFRQAIKYVRLEPTWIGDGR